MKLSSTSSEALPEIVRSEQTTKGTDFEAMYEKIQEVFISDNEHHQNFSRFIYQLATTGLEIITCFPSDSLLMIIHSTAKLLFDNSKLSVELNTRWLNKLPGKITNSFVFELITTIDFLFDHVEKKHTGLIAFKFRLSKNDIFNAIIDLAIQFEVLQSNSVQSPRHREFLKKFGIKSVQFIQLLHTQFNSRTINQWRELAKTEIGKFLSIKLKSQNISKNSHTIRLSARQNKPRPHLNSDDERLKLRQTR